MLTSIRKNTLRERSLYQAIVRGHLRYKVSVSFTSRRHLPCSVLAVYIHTTCRPGAPEIWVIRHTRPWISLEGNTHKNTDGRQEVAHVLLDSLMANFFFFCKGTGCGCYGQHVYGCFKIRVQKYVHGGPFFNIF